MQGGCDGCSLVDAAAFDVDAALCFAQFLGMESILAALASLGYGLVCCPPILLCRQKDGSPQQMAHGAPWCQQRGGTQAGTGSTDPYAHFVMEAEPEGRDPAAQSGSRNPAC